MLIRPVKNRFFLPDAMQMLKAMVAEAADAEGKLSVQDYRDKTGIGRNLSIEILEYFDRQGVTRRIGETRQVMEN
jgi:selenocysteine-specific elongation factor